MSLLTRIVGQHSEVAAPTEGISAQDLAVFQKILHEKAGIVLTPRKGALVESRVAQRLHALQLSSYREYLDHLQKDKTGEELTHLIDVISTNVTNFFREADHFELVDRLVDGWIEAGQRKLRFWTAACSTGEEPYTLAMTLHPKVNKLNLDVRILATDINTKVLQHAQAGIYVPDRLQTVPEDLQRRYFQPVAIQTGSGTGYKVARELQDLVKFHRLNFTVLPYRINGVFDVIFCRNAMIYFDDKLKTRMVREFTRLLRPGGFLIVGHAETLIGIENDYKVIKASVYQRHNDGENG